jgi:hypothetical protein
MLRPAGGLEMGSLPAFYFLGVIVFFVVIFWLVSLAA